MYEDVQRASPRMQYFLRIDMLLHCLMPITVERLSVEGSLARTPLYQCYRASLSLLKRNYCIVGWA